MLFKSWLLPQHFVTTLQTHHNDITRCEYLMHIYTTQCSITDKSKSHRQIYNRSLYCFNLLFSSGKSRWLWKEPVAGWLWEEPVVEWCGKWSCRQRQLRHMRCPKWPLSAWTQVSSLVCHWSMIHHALTLLELTLCLNQLHSQIDFFCISLGSAVTFFRWSGQIYSRLVSSFLRSLCTKTYWNRFMCRNFIVVVILCACFRRQPECQ